MIKGIISENYTIIKKIPKIIIGNKKVKYKVMLIGYFWKHDFEILIRSNVEYIPYKDVIPEWFIIYNITSSFKYIEFKKYTNNNFEEMGEMFKFISYKKPILAVLGNCQSYYIGKILENTDLIVSRYIICYFPFIQDMKEETKTGLKIEYMKYISIFIYQNISISNKFSSFLATKEYVLPLLNSNAIKISIPFVYFDGYYPQFIRNRRNNGQSPYGDAKIQSLLEKGFNIAEVVRQLSNTNLYSETELKENFYKSIQQLKSREELCDIIISDYIVENYQKKCLFYTPSHPITSLLIELVKRVYSFMNIVDYYIESKNLPENDSCEMLIYNSVKNKLKLEFSKDMYRLNRVNGDERYDLYEYVLRYKEANFPEFSENITQKFRTIDISYMIVINEELVNERRPKMLMLNGRCLHMSLYINILKEFTNGIIAKIPPLYAPNMSFISSANIACGSSIPMTVSNSGEIYVGGFREGGKILIIDVTWYMK